MSNAKMDLGNLTDEALNVLHNKVMSEWIKRNAPSEEDIEQMMAEADELLRQAMKGITGA